MSSFLKRGLNDELPDQSAELEEQYKRMMPKIGRDFVAIEDLRDLLAHMLLLLDPLGLAPLGLDNQAARAVAERYKELVEKGKDGGESRRDLVKIDED